MAELKDPSTRTAEGHVSLDFLDNLMKRALEGLEGPAPKSFKSSTSTAAQAADNVRNPLGGELARNHLSDVAFEDARPTRSVRISPPVAAAASKTVRTPVVNDLPIVAAQMAAPVTVASPVVSLLSSTDTAYSHFTTIVRSGNSEAKSLGDVGSSLAFVVGREGINSTSATVLGLAARVTSAEIASAQGATASANPVQGPINVRYSLLSNLKNAYLASSDFLPVMLPQGLSGACCAALLSLLVPGGPNAYTWRYRGVEAKARAMPAVTRFMFPGGALRLLAVFEDPSQMTDFAAAPVGGASLSEPALRGIERFYKRLWGTELFDKAWLTAMQLAGVYFRPPEVKDGVVEKGNGFGERQVTTTLGEDDFGGDNFDKWDGIDYMAERPGRNIFALPGHVTDRDPEIQDMLRQLFVYLARNFALEDLGVAASRDQAEAEHRARTNPNPPGGANAFRPPFIDPPRPSAFDAYTINNAGITFVFKYAGYTHQQEFLWATLTMASQDVNNNAWTRTIQVLRALRRGTPSGLVNVGGAVPVADPVPPMPDENTLVRNVYGGVDYYRLVLPRIDLTGLLGVIAAVVQVRLDSHGGYGYDGTTNLRGTTRLYEAHLHLAHHYALAEADVWPSDLYGASYSHGKILSRLNANMLGACALEHLDWDSFPVANYEVLENGWMLASTPDARYAGFDVPGTWKQDLAGQVYLDEHSNDYGAVEAAVRLDYSDGGQITATYDGPTLAQFNVIRSLEGFINPLSISRRIPGRRGPVSARLSARFGRSSLPGGRNGSAVTASSR